MVGDGCPGLILQRWLLRYEVRRQSSIDHLQEWCSLGDLMLCLWNRLRRKTSGKNEVEEEVGG